MAGLLGGFDPLAALLGPATNTDPLAQYVGSNPVAARYDAIGKVAGGLSDALLYRGPRRNSSGIAGALGQLGSGFKTGAAAAVKSGQERLALDLQKKQALDKLQDDAYARQKEKEQDQALTDMVAGLPPEQRKMLEGNPALAQKFGEEWAEAQFATAKAGSSNHYGQGAVAIRKDPKTGKDRYVWTQQDLSGGPVLEQWMPEDWKPNWAAEVKGAQSHATAEGTVTGKTEAETYFSDLKFANAVGSKIGAMDLAIAGADKYAGMSPTKFVNSAKDLQGWYDWSSTLESVKNTATAASLTEVELYPMTDTDRNFVRSMATVGLDEWRSPADVKRLVGILKDSTRKRLTKIKEGKSLQMPDLDAVLKQFEVPAEVSPPGGEPTDEFEFVRDPVTNKLVKRKVVR